MRIEIFRSVLPFFFVQIEKNDEKRTRRRRSGGGLRNEISVIMKTFSSLFLAIRKEDISQDLPAPLILSLLTDCLLFFKTIASCSSSSRLSHCLPSQSYRVVSIYWRFCLDAIQDRIPRHTPPGKTEGKAGTGEE